jgi:hypothetical protein
VLGAHAAALAGSQDRLAVRDVPEQVAALRQTAAGLTDEAGELEAALLPSRFWAQYHLGELGDCATQATAVGESLVKDQERLQGPDHPGALASRNSLAAAYQEAGRVAEAIARDERTLADRERLLGPDHPDTLTSRNNFAGAYKETERLAGASPRRRWWRVRRRSSS